jgi:hypothetical protein
MGVVGRVCVCIAVVGALVGSMFVTSSPASAQSALLDALSRRVTLAHPSGAAGEISAEQIIRSGDTVATDETGRAVITYADGSTALLEESSALTIEFVQTSAGDYAVRMQQTLGRVWYAVTRAVTLGTRYEVRSAGMASVIRAGSDSYVTVSPTGETTVVTISGSVDTSAGGVEVSVPAGSSTTVSGPGATPLPVRPAPTTTQPAASTPSPKVQPPSAPSSTTTPTRAPTKPSRTATPSPTSAFQPPVTTLPPLPVMSATPKPRTPAPSPSLVPPLFTPKPLAAPAPTPRPLKDRFGPRKDAPGPPPSKIQQTQ